MIIGSRKSQGDPEDWKELGVPIYIIRSNSKAAIGLELDNQ